MEKYKELIPEVIENTLVFISSSEDELRIKISKVLENFSIKYLYFNDSSDLLNKIKSTPANLLFVDEDITENIPLFCEQVKLFSKDCQINLIIKNSRSKNRDVKKTGCDSYISVGSELSFIEEIISNFIDKKHRLAALKMISFNNKKKDIIGEISNFSNHVKQLNELKEKNSKLEDKIEDLIISKERLAAEIRAKHKLIMEIEVKLEKVEEENFSLKEKIKKVEKINKLQEEKLNDSSEYFDFIEQRLLKVSENIDKYNLKSSESELKKALDKIKLLEEENRKSSKIFDNIIAVLTKFVSGKDVTIEETFEKIINYLAEFTSI